MNHHAQQVAEFHKAFDIPILDSPQVPNQDRVKLRARLVAEESQEVIEAMESRNLQHIAKEMTDLMIVLHGAALEFGLQHVMDQVMDEVHRSNMSKLGADGKPVYRADGKVLKGPNYSEADLTFIG
jgi:predicted HAD superfamily Cof-like phosphohydrolase